MMEGLKKYEECREELSLFINIYNLDVRLEEIDELLRKRDSGIEVTVTPYRNRQCRLNKLLRRLQTGKGVILILDSGEVGFYRNSVNCWDSIPFLNFDDAKPESFQEGEYIICIKTWDRWHALGSTGATTRRDAEEWVRLYTEAMATETRYSKYEEYRSAFARRWTSVLTKQDLESIVAKQREVTQLIDRLEQQELQKMTAALNGISLSDTEVSFTGLDGASWKIKAGTQTVQKNDMLQFVYRHRRDTTQVTSQLILGRILEMYQEEARLEVTYQNRHAVYEKLDYGGATHHRINGIRVPCERVLQTLEDYLILGREIERPQMKPRVKGEADIDVEGTLRTPFEEMKIHMPFTRTDRGWMLVMGGERIPFNGTKDDIERLRRIASGKTLHREDRHSLAAFTEVLRKCVGSERVAHVMREARKLALFLSNIG